MKEVIDFLNNSKVYYLATTDGNTPHVRPLGFVMEYNGKLAFCTNNQKDMYRQMVANPMVEISCVDADMNTLRICGKAKFCTNEDSQKKALDIMPMLGSMYAVGDGKFEIFCLDEPKAVCVSMKGDKKEFVL